jgi:aspartyl-tRNA(Asn)/glutamyl-tRNA(Gln) amidotransferase subunit A
MHKPAAEEEITSLHDLSATDLIAGYRAKQFSPSEVLEEVIEHIAAWEPHIKALYLFDPDGARAAAKASTDRWQRDEPAGALDGVPVTIKDNIATKGQPIPLGAASVKLIPAEKDAPPAARLRESGAIIFSKTTMPDYGMLSSGLSSFHPLTRNPWDLSKNPGGSSSGAGAAGAAGYGPLHLGTDIGGSVRLPATHCGLFALKPSLGRVPVHPPYMGRVAGPMTRSVEDAALLMNAIARPDARDFMSLPYEETDFAEDLDALSAKGLKIAFLADMGVGLPVHPEVRAAAEAAAAALAAAGCIVEPIRSFLNGEMFDGMCRFFEARSYHDFMQLGAAKRAQVLPFIAEWCSWRAQGFSGRDVMQAYASVMAMREAAVAAGARFDFVLSPTSPILPYAAELAAPGNDPRNALPHIAFTVPYNMSEQPAASINWTASAEGLPIGVQLIGRRFDDRGVLRISRLIEMLRPAQRAWPD